MNSTKTASLSRKSHLRSIREKCIDCCAGNKAEVRGRNPKGRHRGDPHRGPLRFQTIAKRKPPKKETMAIIDPNYFFHIPQ